MSASLGSAESACEKSTHVLHDVTDPLGALLRLDQRLPQVGEHEAEIHLVGDRGERIIGFVDRLHRARRDRLAEPFDLFPDPLQVAQVFPHLRQVGVNETHWIVDLVSNTRG